VDTITVTALSDCVARCADTVVVRVRQQPVSLRATQRRLLIESLGDVIPLDGEARDRNGVPVSDVLLTTVIPQTPAIAVRSAGVWRAIANGTTTALLRLGALEDTVSLTVRQRVAEVVSIRPLLSPVAAPNGRLDTLFAEARDARGIVLQRADVRWGFALPNPNILRVLSATNMAGQFQLVAQATMATSRTIAITADSVTRTVPFTSVVITTATVTVTDSVLVLGRDTLALSLTARDALGRLNPGVRPTWRSRDTTIARVDSVAGRVIGRAPGAVFLTGEIFGGLGVVRDSVRVRVAPPAPVRAP
jgi:hypothetical protein